MINKDKIRGIDFGKTVTGKNDEFFSRGLFHVRKFTWQIRPRFQHLLQHGNLISHCVLSEYDPYAFRDEIEIRR